MARVTDVGGDAALTRLWRRPLAGGRSRDGWLECRTERLLQAIAQRPVRLAYLCEHLRRLKDITNDSRVVAALADTTLRKENGP